MNYPFWDVAGIGAGWVIGIIAIFHIMISHFAVGGGLLIPMLEYRAQKQRHTDWQHILHRNMKFFLIVTGVLGTVSGVGIWFSIGLAQPTATSALIHIFVFFWAIEWVFFLIELTSAAVYYYTWGRISDRLHLMVGWVYTASSFITLMVINAILSFMMNPGADWLRANYLQETQAAIMSGVFNPTYWPSLFIRTLGCFSLAAAFVLLSCSRVRTQFEPAQKRAIVRYTTYWFVPAFLLLPLCLFWYLCLVPDSQLYLFTVSAMGLKPMFLTVIFGSVLTTIVAFLLTRNTWKFTPGRAWIILFLAAIVVGAAEYGREALRKPFVIGDYMYSNGVLVSDVATYNKRGHLSKSLWVNKKSDYGVGEAIFRGQCMVCHTWDGYRSMKDRIQGRSVESLQSILTMLYEYNPESAVSHYMPPLVGTMAERRALAAWLEQKANGKLQKTAPKEKQQN